MLHFITRTIVSLRRQRSIRTCCFLNCFQRVFHEHANFFLISQDIPEETALRARSRKLAESREFLASVIQWTKCTFGFTPNSQRIHCTLATSTHLRWTEFLSHDDAAFRYDRVRVPHCARVRYFAAVSASNGTGCARARARARARVCASGNLKDD